MWSLYITLLILSFTSGVYMEACPAKEDIKPCECEEEEDGELVVICSDESLDLKALRQSLDALSGKTDVGLYLWDLKLGNLPSDFFSGISIKRLEFANCYIHSLSNDDQPEFLGLENHLEELTIKNGFTQGNFPTKLRLGHLKKLREVELSSNAITEIGDDWFSNGPSSLEKLVIFNNNIEKIGNNAFSKLNNLKQLSFSVNRCGSIRRSMFPSSADRLERLVLEDNGLTSIPEDIFSRMPSISSISLEYNHITTLDERTWSPIWQKLGDLYLEGNDIHCDDRLNWIFRLKKKPHVYGSCSDPRDLEGRKLKEFFRSRSS